MVVAIQCTACNIFQRENTSRFLLHYDLIEPLTCLTLRNGLRQFLMIG